MNRSIIDDQRTSAVQLGAEELQRYSRHLIMPEVTADGQRRLKAARVLCIGAGGLGSPAALYLSAAGVGTIGIVDFDDVDLSNLQRQILHGTKDVGRGKLESARDRLHDINPQIETELHKCRFSSENASQLVARYDVVVDGSDNFPTRYLSNDVSVFENKPIEYEQFCGVRDEGEISEMSPHQLKRKIDAGEPFELIDVREPFEYEIARIDGAKLIPLGEISERLDELSGERPIVVHCHTGKR